jgi:phosphoribosylglycinamide formyltransferase-1
MNKRLVVPLSGTGSLFEAMVQAGLHVTAVIADRDCRGLQVARDLRIPRFHLARRDFRIGGKFDREGYTKAFVDRLDQLDAGFVAMAGFMTILSPNRYLEAGRILNIHPSLLPDFKGHSAVEDALHAGVKETGSTVHVATDKLDEGPILAQERVPVLSGDTVETLHERIKQKERVMYPKVIRQFMAAM